MKRLEFCMVLGLMLSVMTAAFAPFSSECRNIEDSVVRLHVIANSDAQADQTLKLKVRDAVLEKCGLLFSENESKSSAENAIAQNLAQIETVANEVIKANGFSYTAKATLKKEYFETRVYKNVTLPAGRYDSLCLRLGEAEGKNWWCVVFPPMCLPCADEETELNEVLDEDGIKIVTESGNYKIKFKIWELIKQLESAKQ